MPVKALMTVLVMVACSGMALAAESNEPDAELLEFLADWDSGGDQWIEPFSFEQADTDDEQQENADVQAIQENDNER